MPGSTEGLGKPFQQPSGGEVPTSSPQTGQLGGKRVQKKTAEDIKNEIQRFQSNSPITLFQRIVKWVTGGGWTSRRDVTVTLSRQLVNLKALVSSANPRDRNFINNGLRNLKETLDQLKGSGASKDTLAAIETIENGIFDVLIETKSIQPTSEELEAGLTRMDGRTGEGSSLTPVPGRRFNIPRASAPAATAAPAALAREPIVAAPQPSAIATPQQSADVSAHAAASATAASSTPAPTVAQPAAAPSPEPLRDIEQSLMRAGVGDDVSELMIASTDLTPTSAAAAIPSTPVEPVIQQQQQPAAAAPVTAPVSSEGDFSPPQQSDAARATTNDSAPAQTQRTEGRIVSPASPFIGTTMNILKRGIGKSAVILGIPMMAAGGLISVVGMVTIGAVGSKDIYGQFARYNQLRSDVFFENASGREVYNYMLAHPSPIPPYLLESFVAVVGGGILTLAGSALTALGQHLKNN